MRDWSSLAALYPASGNARVSVDIGCSPLAGAHSAAFDLCINPTGTVVNGAGNPIPDAQVTLYVYDAVTTSLRQVLADDARLSPANRANPDRTDAAGHFGWDVLTGVYVVRAAKAGCVSPANPDLAYAQTELLSVPLEWVDLELRLACPDESSRIYLPLIVR